jgi:DNA-binding transcriptional ArsR family regulator
MRLFLNPNGSTHLRELASEFDISPSQVREELQRLDQAGLLKSEKQGRQIKYRANQEHRLYPELNSMVRKALGMDRILESIIERLGELEQAWLIDDYAEGKDSGLIDLLLIGNINMENLADLVKKTERYVGRKIRPLVMTSDEFKQHEKLFVNRPALLLWSGTGTSATDKKKKNKT